MLRRSPWGPLRYLPWDALLGVALMTVLGVVAVEWLFFLGLTLWPNLLGSLLNIVLTSPFAGILPFAIALAIGALAVFILEHQRFWRLSITTEVLWGLVPCLLLAWILKEVLPITPLGVMQFFFTKTMSVTHLFVKVANSLTLEDILGWTVGIFIQGRRYWR
ncbi:hypothetical protein ACN4EG_09875 [Alkalinema pantanalense CENA528]|uniref:hypothetical protein n=1 Tax=Alkalinema pantanalense TaxID=1620705 RepID=UPI003D6DE045